MIVGAPLFCRRLVGREREFATLRERYQEAAHGRGSLIIVTGEAGIGKTRFLFEVLQKLKADGATCLRSQFFEHVSTPMGPLVEIFRELYEILPIAIDQESESARFGDVESGSIDSVIFDSRASQFASIADTLLRCAAAPLVLAIEDIHWADPTTLECLQYLASRVEGARLLFILTYRSESLDHRQTPTAEFTKLTHQANVWKLALQPLENAEMQTLLNETVPANRQLSGEDRFRILELAEGNPLFAEELLRDGLEFGVSRRLPASISALFLQRLESFSTEGRLLLSQAAAIGKRFDAELLARVSNQSFEAVLAVLRAARAVQIIVEDAESASSYNFRHALVREAFYDELLAVEARPLHRRIAEHLEEFPQSEERTFELAYHWWAAREPEKAVQYNQTAAEIASARFARESAVRCCDRALEFVADGTLTQAELRHRQARQLWLCASNGRHAAELLERAFEYFECHGPAHRVAEIANVLGQYHWWLGAGDLAVMWFQRALEAMGDNKAHPQRTDCLISLARIKLIQGSLEEARGYAKASEESLLEAPLEQHAQYLEFLITLATVSGDFESALAAYERFRSFFDNSKWETCVLARSAWSNVADSFQRFGELDIADYALERSRLAVLARPSLPFLAIIASRTVTAFLLRGRFSDAAALVNDYRANQGQMTETVGDVVRHIAPEAAVLAARALRADLLAEIAADKIVELTFDSSNHELISEIASAYAEWFATNHERSKALDLIAKALGVIGDNVFVPPGCAVAFALYGNAAAARWSHNMLARWATPASNRTGRAYLALVDAILLNKRPARAVRLARAAAEGFHDVGLPYYEALALERCGSEKQALDIYRRIGDERDARRLAAEIDPMNRRGRRAAELTARESEIADLIAEGKSNRVIAERLVLSQRTVETHVASIFSKLEVSARSDVADRVAQHR